MIDIISVHIPKTAGTTFRNLLIQAYGGDQVCCDYQGKYDGPGTTSVVETTKVVHGHFFIKKYAADFPNAKKIAWLRHPISRLISHYFYWKSLPNPPVDVSNMGILEFAETKPMQNRMAKFLRGVKLEQFYFIGIQEFFVEDLQDFKSMLSLSNLELNRHDNVGHSPEYYQLVQDVLDNTDLMLKLLSLNSEDFEIYERSLGLRAKRLGQFSAFHQVHLSWQKSKIKLSQAKFEIKRLQEQLQRE